MMKRLIVLILMVHTSLYSLEKEYQPLVQRFIDYVKNNKVEELSKIVKYPLSRYYPIKAIESAEEFVKRYNQTFGKEVIDQIVKSGVEKDWDRLGDKGIMLVSSAVPVAPGTVWLDLEGNLAALNDASSYEKQASEELMVAERAKVHPSLKDFESSPFEFKTKKFLVRIDDMGKSYRYAAWSLPKGLKDKPDLVLQGGEMEWDGSGGNHHYSFKNGSYTYWIDVAVLSCDEKYLGELTVTKNKKEILRQNILEILE